MGVGGKVNQGLWITTRDVAWDQGSHDLTRVSEVGVIMTFGDTAVDVAGIIRNKGLKIGMLFRNGHQIGPDPGAHKDHVEFTAAAKNSPPAGLPWLDLAPDNGVSQRLKQVFGNVGQWIGYTIAGNTIPHNTWPGSDDRLYFRVMIRNFTPNQAKDVHVVPMVCILADLDFASHYVLGIGAFTVGHGGNGLEFDTQVITRDPPQPTEEAGYDGGATPSPKARKPPARRRRPRRDPPARPGPVRGRSPRKKR